MHGGEGEKSQDNTTISIQTVLHTQQRGVYSEYHRTGKAYNHGQIWNDRILLEKPNEALQPGVFGLPCLVYTDRETAAMT